MFFIFGSRLFGKVDEIPGVGYVATKFGHVNFLPLIPMQGWLITEQSGNGWRGMPIPMSAKSVFIAYGRAISIVAGAVLLVMGMIAIGDGRGASEGLPMLAIGAGFIGFFIFTKVSSTITKASFNRACEIGRAIGMGERWMNQMEELYGESQKSYGFEPVRVEPNGGGWQGSNVVLSQPVQAPAGTMDVQTYYVTGRDTRTNQQVCMTVHARDENHAREQTPHIEVAEIEPAGMISR